MDTKDNTYTSISEMLKAQGASPQLIEGYIQKVADTQLIKSLIAMRQKRGKTQKDVSAALDCTQSRVSKIESSTDTELTVGYLKKYAEALDFKLIVTFVPKQTPAVEQIKYHAWQIEQHLADLARLANNGTDASLSGSIGNFFGESLYNLVGIVARQARKLPPSVGFEIQVVDESKVPARQLSLPAAPPATEIAGCK
jgi:transcriptional regulator with XRE-family HTH domain